MTHLMNTYGRLPVAFARGEGAWLWDEQGKRTSMRWPASRCAGSATRIRG